MRNDHSPYCMGRAKLYVHSNPEEMSGAFTMEQIAAANSRHDSRYGWTPMFSQLYTNILRHPETLIGRIEDYWARRSDASTQAQ